MGSIRDLTDEEFTNLVRCQEQWAQARTCTDPADRAPAEKAVARVYKLIGADPPEFVWELSPRAALKALQSLRPDVLFWNKSPVVRWKRLRDSLWQIASTNRLRDLTVDVQIRFRDRLREYVEEALQDWFTNSRLRSYHYPLWGYGDDLVGFYLFCRDVLGVPYDRQASHYLDCAAQIERSCYWWWPAKGVCFFSDRPRIVTMERRPWFEEIRLHNGRLHNDSGPAVRFPDGWSIYALHGIRVPAEIIETPPDQLDPRILLGIRNTEIRRELIGKIGMDRICRELDVRILDKRGKYELIGLDLGDSRVRPYLKMLNPSTGEWHVEGVHPKCTSVKEALAWRNRTHVPPAILT